MKTRSLRSLWPIALILVVAAAVGGYFTWDQFLRGDNVAPLGLSSPTPSTAGASAASANPSTSADPFGSPTVSTAPIDAASIAGTWSVAEGSVAGYRVREKLASLPAQSDAVGRSSGVSGEATLTAAGNTVRVTAAEFTVDMTALKSDKNTCATIGSAAWRSRPTVTRPQRSS